MARKKEKKTKLPNGIYLRGSTYYARFSTHARLQRVSLQTSDLQEAKLRLKSLKLSYERRFFGIEEAPKWQDAVVSYCQIVLDSGSVKPSTAKRYRTSLRMIDPYFCGLYISEIVPRKISEYVSKRQASGATNATIRRDLSTINRVLAVATAQGLVETNPALGFDRGLIKERRAPIKVLPNEEIETAAKQTESINPAIARLIRFLKATGMRSGEALRARWEHINDDELLIPDTKNGRARTIRIKNALSLFDGDKKEGRLFPELSEDSGFVAHQWGSIKRRSTLPKFRLHDLRHAYAIEQIRKGRDIYDLSHHLGHSSVKVTEIYLGYTPGHRSVSR